MCTRVNTTPTTRIKLRNSRFPTGFVGLVAVGIAMLIIMIPIIKYKQSRGPKGPLIDARKDYVNVGTNAGTLPLNSDEVLQDIEQLLLNFSNILDDAGFTLLLNPIISVCASHGGEIVLLSRHDVLEQRKLKLYMPPLSFGNQEVVEVNKSYRGVGLVHGSMSQHFPHFAQNFMPLLSILNNFSSIGRKLNMYSMIQANGVSESHGSEWIFNSIKYGFVSILLNKKSGSSYLGEDGELWEEVCNSVGDTYMISFDALVIRNRAALGKIWFDSPTSCSIFRDSIVDSFISRSDIDHSKLDEIALIDRSARSIGNLNELLLMHRNLAVFSFDNISFTDQIRIMVEHNVFIMAHGAGVMNIVFAEPEAIIFEIYPYNYYPKYRWYTKLATSCGHYSYPIHSMEGAEFEKSCMHRAKRPISEHSTQHCMRHRDCRICARKVNVLINATQLAILLNHFTG